MGWNWLIVPTPFLFPIDCATAGFLKKEKKKENKLTLLCSSCRGSPWFGINFLEGSNCYLRGIFGLAIRQFSTC